MPAPEHLVAKNEHGLYCVPRASRHRPASRTVLASRVWEADTIDLVRAADPERDIVHAGAFFGDFIPALARSRRGGALVWAFEPSLENHRCAELTVRLNELDNVTLLHAGLGASAGTAVLATSDRAGTPLGGASRIVEAEAEGRWSTSETVDLIAIDEVVDSRRDVAAIQLDVEGGERQALSGAMRTIERCRPLLVLEGLPEPGWIADNLTPLGYVAGGTVDANSVLRCE